MIQRINFIETKAFSFTYTRIAQIYALILAMFFVAFGAKFYQTNQLQNSVKSIQKNLVTLQAEEQQLQQAPVKESVDIGEYQELYEKIVNIPKYSQLMDDITSLLPKQITLTNFKSKTELKEKVGQSITIGKNKDENKPQKTKPTFQSQHKIEISGISPNAKVLTDFLAKLRKSSFFENPVLAESQKEKFGYTFKIISQVE